MVRVIRVRVILAHHRPAFGKTFQDISKRVLASSFRVTHAHSQHLMEELHLGVITEYSLGSTRTCSIPTPSAAVPY
jgi:hypothetical protein